MILYQLFTKLLNLSITASIVIFAVLLVRGIMYYFHLPKKYCYILWGIVAIRLLCPITISSSLSLFNIIGINPVNIISMEINDTRINNINNNNNNNSFYNFTDNKLPDTFLTDNKKETIISEHNSADFTPSEQEKDFPLPFHFNTLLTKTTSEKRWNPLIQYGSIVWFVGILLILSWNFYITFHMKKQLEKAVRYKENIYECENIPSPFVMGIFHPKIYIPFQLNTEEQKYILKHELYHIKRKDYMIKPIAFFIVCIYWFHPLVWLSYFFMIRDMEMSCDEYVLLNTTEDIRKNYSKSLLGFATNQRGMAASLLTFGETDTRKRVKNVLYFKKHGKWIGILAVILIIIAGIACLTNGKDIDTKAVAKKDNTTKKNKPEHNTIKDTIEKNDLEKNNLENFEAIITTSTIHGYEVKLVYLSQQELSDKNDLEFDMYEGSFELRTYHEENVCAVYPLTFDFKDTLFYPKEGFELIVKDYDGDGNADDFSLGQGQTSLPTLGNFMCYQFYTVDEDGSITKYQFSEDKTYLVTIPDSYSKDFSCKNGQITYQALGENGVEQKTLTVIRIIPINTETQEITMQPLKDLMTNINIVMPEPVKKEIKENGCWRLSNGTYNLGNAVLSDDITMRLDFSYYGTNLIQYVSKEYGFIDNLPDDRITKEQAKELIVTFISTFLGREIDKTKIKDYKGYQGYSDEKDYAAFIDDNKNTFLVQLSKNMIIKYDGNKKQFKQNAFITEENIKKDTQKDIKKEQENFDKFSSENNMFHFKHLNVTIKLPENPHWIENASVSTEDNIGIVTYYDAIAETNVTLRFGKKDPKTLLGFSDIGSDRNELWSFFTGEKENFIEVQFYSLENSKETIVLSWEYNQIHFFMSADFTNSEVSEKNNSSKWESLAKTAAYIAENYYRSFGKTILHNKIFS